jgi:hypothetical protein
MPFALRQKDHSASKRNHMKRDIRARFYKMVAKQWLRFIRFFGLRIGRYNAISTLLQDDFPNHLHSGSPDNISNLDFVVTLLAAHIADNTVVQIAPDMQEFIETFCVLKVRSKAAAAAVTAQGMQPQVAVAAAGKKGAKTTQPEVGQRPMRQVSTGDLKGNYAYDSFLFFDIDVKREDFNPKTQEALKGVTCLSLFQLSTLLLMHTVLKDEGMEDNKSWRVVSQEAYFVQKHVSFQDKGGSIAKDVKYNKWLSSVFRGEVVEV